MVLRDGTPRGSPKQCAQSFRGSGTGQSSPPSQEFALRPDILTWPLSPVLEALNILVNKPNLQEPLRMELADLLRQDPELFHRSAEKHTLEFGEHRPS